MQAAYQPNLEGAVKDPTDRRNMSRRSVLGILGGAAVVGLGLGELLARDACAQEGTQYAAAGQGQYQTVEQILANTPFRVVDLPTYQREIQQPGVTVGFLYEGNDLNTPSGRLARLFENAMRQTPPDPRIDFVAMPYQAGLEGDYRELGITGTPAVAFYQNGTRIHINNGGPTSEERLQALIPVMSQDIGTLNSLI